MLNKLMMSNRVPAQCLAFNPLVNYQSMYFSLGTLKFKRQTSKSKRRIHAVKNRLDFKPELGTRGLALEEP
jgi:hypothetical protein